MGLKALELQVAIPRTVDLGQWQDHENKKPSIAQHQQQEKQKLETEMDQTKPEKVFHPYKGKRVDVFL